jgi:hypothetical protein
MQIDSKKLTSMIREELQLFLLVPDERAVEPRDVTDAYHPSEVEPREDAWSGGDNIEDARDHARFETGEGNAGPHDSISWSHDPDSVTPGEAFGVGYAACEHDLTINEDRGMRSGKTLMTEVLNLISEGHGCGCGTCKGCGTKEKVMSMAMEPLSDYEEDEVPGMTHIIDMGGLDSDGAFGAGYSAGREQRDEFSFTGDISDLSPDEAIGVGYEAGMMGIGGDDAPHPESYHTVRRFLSHNPEMVDAAVRQLMDITGSTCPKSTRKAIVDHLSTVSHDHEPEMEDHSMMMHTPQSRSRG